MQEKTDPWREYRLGVAMDKADGQDSRVGHSIGLRPIPGFLHSCFP